MDPSRLSTLINDALPDLRTIRRDIHAHPELGYREHRTAGVVTRELDKLAGQGVRYKAGLAGGTGVVAWLPASGSTQGKAVGLRADMDALPILEQTGVPYASTTPGLMHACGHDGHTTILIGAARVLANLPERPNPVVFCFQPAEEGGGGGDRLCKDGAMNGAITGTPIGRMFGLHCWPELGLGQIGTRPGPLLASTDEIRVTIKGVQSHGAYPHYSRDTIVCAAHCITLLQTVVSRNIDPLQACVVTIGKIEGGTATNIIPERTSFIGTIRALTPETRATARQRVRTICEQTAAAMGCTAEVELNEGYPVTFNDPELTNYFFGLARNTLGEAHVETIANPVMGGEDFSFYGQHAPAVFFCLGIKPTDRETYPTVHQPDFDFNDDALPVGVEMFCRLALDRR